MFTTASLAARIERAEAESLRDLAHAAAARRDHDVVIRELGGGLGLYVAPRSPANKLFGLGFAELPSTDELSAVEQAFERHDAPLHAEVSSLADPSLLPLLTTRGYELIGFENVMGRALSKADVEAALDTSVHVAPVGRDDTALWMDAVTAGFLAPDTFDGPPSHESPERDDLERLLRDTVNVPTFERFLARRGGAVAGGASMRLHEGVALLAGAATVPEQRRQGVQTALLRYRLRDAARRGSEIAVVTTQPGSKSTENVQKFGFAVLYVRAILRKSPG